MTSHLNQGAVSRRRRLAAAFTAASLIGASVIAGAVSTPQVINALPGPSESTVVNVDPTRVLDSRIGVGLVGKFEARVSRKLMVTGPIETYEEATNTKTNKIVVPAGATGVIMNVTAVAPTAAGFLSIRPGSATGYPSTAGLNFKPGDTVPNHITVGIPTTGPNAGQIDITYGQVLGQTMDVVIDIVGYTTSAGLIDLVNLVALKANTADVYAKTETYTKTEIDAALLARTPIARSARSDDITPDPTTDAIILSVTIEAPVAGTLVAVGSTWISAGAAAIYECQLTTDDRVITEPPGAPFVDTDRRLDKAAGADAVCTTNGSATVTAGTHKVNLAVDPNSAVGANFNDSTLDVVFYPTGMVSPALIRAADSSLDN